ncbi:MAG: putative selenate reductase subunit YgfK [Ignavibacteriales bacterium]|nr:putative selenate reductase subunit YgfK [Ignavibacteriales bacterium]
MSDKMQPILFRKLINWVLSEYVIHKMIFGIPAIKFYFPKTKTDEKIFGEELETPVGPAAGPHTQLAQNIISAYLVGGRFFELKTVQKLDNLKIDKPCIDASDEGYNVEWSQELSLDESYSEYLKAWFLIHLLKEILGMSQSERGFVFNMSVGYDLEGIKTERMDRFIDELKDASKNKLFAEYKLELKDLLCSGDTIELLTKEFGLTGSQQNLVLEKIEKISPHISNSVTLSTMHGCPPQEIESIAKYLIQEKALHTYVKLNPTLLGYDFVNDTLHKLGFKYITLDKSSFDHDLQYKDAIPMLNRLRSLASANNRIFGIKLSNTLGVKNTLRTLPGDDMYMSGRSLFPLTINLAHKLADEFNGEINISYSGGANFINIQEILQTGIRPITFATELLKPGGYLRLAQITEAAEKNYLKIGRGNKINLSILQTVAEVSLSDRNYSKDKHEISSIKISKSLPVFDCFIAPCQEACPIHQDVAAYIKLVEQKRYAEAYELIVTKNPLPHITGYICDHQCMYHCTRWDYDEPVLIRDLKKEAAEKGYSTYISKFKAEFLDNQNNIKVAIIGAGPSGLSAAYFSAKAGFDVTIFEKEMNAGGIVKNVLPKFRLPKEAIEKDIEFIEKHGIRFIFGMEPNFSIEKLKKEGFKYIYIAIGAEDSNKILLDGDEINIYNAIEFLHDFNSEQNYKLGKSVAVIGGGNSAMDSARAAKRHEGVRKVYLIYRRTREEMPADKEEFYAALNDEVEFKELLLPVKFKDGILTCQKMVRDQIGADGRKNVVPIEGEFEEIQVDSVVSAIGENVYTEYLTNNNIPLDKNKVKVTRFNETIIENVFIGGDALRGPSTVVQSIADGKTAADAIIKKEKIDNLLSPSKEYITVDQVLSSEIAKRKGLVIEQNHSDLSIEAGRCLGCNFICNKCAEVCPNRANVVIKTDSLLFNNVNQILHLDALCNECGNCETFCPYESAPYKEKFTLYWSEEEFKNGSNDGFFLRQNDKRIMFDVRWQKENGTVFFDKDGNVKSSFANNDGIENLVQLISSVRNDYSFLLQ